MLTDHVQRWSMGRSVYRPAGETIQTRHYEVEEIAADAPARAFIESRHYSRSYPAARFRVGLYRSGALVGVAVFSVPCNERALAPLPGQGLERVELGRFVLEDSVRANGESWMLARAFELLRKRGIVSVLSFSDPEPRTSLDGAIVFPGHIGTIYQASNAAYLGRATPRVLRVLPDGTVLNARAIQKLRAGETGWRYVAERMTLHGAARLDDVDDRGAWLQRWLPLVTRPLRHPGNHRYAWALHRRDRRYLPESQAYPKFQVASLALPGARATGPIRRSVATS